MMRKFWITALACCIITFAAAASEKLHRQFDELPPGAVKPAGWLKEMLVRQRDGITANMDVLYPQVMGERNGWLGGDGDQWERGPYWIDGLLPLAYILDDNALKAKAGRWVEWALSSQQENGQFGPITDYPSEPGLQRNRSEDWWPRIVVLKILMQYYDATSDPRVLDFMSGYFKYQLETLPSKPLGKWAYWAEYRQCDNMIAVLWLYDKTGEEWLLDLAGLLHSQGFDYISYFMAGDGLGELCTIHCVNLAQGLKEPLIYGQISGDTVYNDICRTALDRIRIHDGFPNGMYGADEALHGNNPTQGVELCSIIEMMYSLEQMIQVSGDLSYADHLEKVAFNALPTQISDDFKLHQYFQMPNQVNITKGFRNFDCEQEGTPNIFGFLTGFPCCLSNLHQGWPKFTRDLWMKPRAGGLAALYYSPCSVSTTIGNEKVTLKETTCYPFDETVLIEVSEGRATFPIQLRIPSWCDNPVVKVNGKEEQGVRGGTLLTLNRRWKRGDVIELTFPMHFEISRWYENSASVERGPLVYALKLTENWQEKEFSEDEFNYKWMHGKTYWEVTTKDAWNYGLLDVALKDPEKNMSFHRDDARMGGDWLWSPDGCPVSVTLKAVRFPQWTLYNGMAGPVPYTRKSNPTFKVRESETESVTLIPYGCTTLRISEFPVARLIK